MTHNNNTYPKFRWLLIVLISCVVLLFGSSNKCFSQTDIKKDIFVSFLKQTDSLKTSELYFNILKIHNTSSNPIAGNVIISCPENWKIIAFPLEQTVIEPGDSALIPIRVSPANNTLGGTSYIVNGTFKTKDKQYSANTYIALPSITKWDFNIFKTKAYFTEKNPNSDLQIHLSNKGNTTELIRLDLELGKLLKMSKSNTTEYLEFINLPAYKDTTITYSVSYKENLSFSERVRYEKNWKESSIKAKASRELDYKSATVQFHKLYSTFTNQRAENSSPLNIDYYINNLLSTQKPRSNVKLYGSILFNKSRAIHYYAGVNNLSHDFNNPTNFNINQQLIYSLRYSDLKNNVELGYNIYGGSLHAINGRGINGAYNISNKSKISYTFTHNPYSNIIGGHLGFASSIGNLSFNTNATHEEDLNGKYKATSASIGAGFNILKHHSFSFQLLGSKAHYIQQQRDTNLLGFSYNAGYSLKLKKFNFRINAIDSRYNYIRNSGMQQYYVDSKFQMTDNSILSLYGNRQYYSTTRYPFNFDNIPNYNSSDYLRLIYSFSKGNIVYQLGPNYNGSMRQLLNYNTGYKSVFTTYQPGVWSAVSINIGENKMLTPNITVNNLRFYYKTNDPALLSFSSTENIYYSAGINFSNKVLRLNAYYTSGSIGDLYRSVQMDTKPVITKSVQFRPSYENLFFDQKVKLSAYINYAYYMPSGSENTSFNIKSELYLKKGFTLSFNGFLFSNRRNDKEFGSISSKDLNFIVGFRKSFNIQQPRLKYYNYKALFFNDLDGNKLKSDNEPPVPEILVNVEKNRDISPGKSYIPETELISDVNGEINIINLPKDNYKLRFTPMSNLKSLYFLNGNDQLYLNDKSRTMLVPLAESYKIKGKIIIIRDANSSEGDINLSGVRITAKNIGGDTYSALTDNFGGYTLYVTSPDIYTVDVNNVFGEYFSIEQDEMEVQFVQNRTINLDFTFIEKKRGIQFEKGTELFNFNKLIGDSTTSKPTPVTALPEKKKAVVVESAKNYSIQLDVLKIYRSPSFYKEKFKLKNEVLYTDDNGEFKYLTGNFPTIEAANAEIKKLNLIGIPVATDKLKLKREIVTETPKAPVLVAETATNSTAKDTKTASTIKTENEVNNAVVSEKSNQNTVLAKPVEAPKVIVAPKDGTVKLATDNTKNQGLPVDNSKTKVENPQTGKKVEGSKENTTAVVISDIQYTQRQDTLPVGKYYSIQLDAQKTYRYPTEYNAKYNLKDPVICVQENGQYKYFVGKYNTVDAARADIAKFGLSGYIIMVEDLDSRKIDTVKK